jgi:uncharacterized RmlC-like cupin family protein
VTWHAHSDTLAALLPGIPTETYPEGVPFRTAIATGTMSVELFRPVGTDRQQPHAHDELYVVVTGQARLVRGESMIEVKPGDVLFVPAGMEHCFVDIADGFTAWVVFVGPQGAERATPATTSATRFAQDVVAPLRLVTAHFVLEPLAPRHNARDHAAWSTSIEHIRTTPGFAPQEWGGDEWPQPMTAEENLRDLEQHAAEFAAAEAFAFSVLDPTTADVIGCVYIDPDPTAAADAMCRSWVRADRANLDSELAATVHEWLTSAAWPFTTVRWPGRTLDAAPSRG